VFIVGRALNEGVFSDASRIAFNADNTGGKSGEDLLKEYGIDIIVMDGFEWGAGLAYYLPAALADPAQKEWKLVFRDAHNVIFMRNPPPGLPVLDSAEALVSMEAQCALYVDRNRPQCVKGMIDVFQRVGDRARLNKWMEISRLHPAQSSFVIAQ
jgi:hypothetical protein